MRIIINNTSVKSDVDAMKLVISVIQGGLISNFGKSYCYVTVFQKDKVVIYSKKNSELSHTFYISDISND
jgi:hypothetical protein